MKRLEGFSLWVLRVFAAAIFLFLTVYSFRFTQDILPTEAEIPVDTADSVGINILFAVGAALLFFLLFFIEKKLSLKTRHVVEYVSLAVAVIAVTAVSLWWVRCEVHMPQADQLYLLVGASHFASGDFTISSSSYFSIYPHQLGPAFFMQWILKIVGPYNYVGLQYINVALAAGVVVLGFVVLKQLNSKTCTLMLYCLFMTFCFPLMGYTQWVYGEIASLFFMIAFLILALKYDDNGRFGYIIPMIVCASIACLVRKNTYVFMVAFLIVALIKWLADKKYSKVAVALVVFLSPLLAYKGVYAYYANASGYVYITDEAMPTSAWIEMGLEDAPERGPGWYRDVVSEFHEFELNSAEYAEASKGKITTRLKDMSANPGYAVSFFRRKALSQWNEPLFESIFFGTRFSGDYTIQSKYFDYWAYGKGYGILEFIADRLHSICLIGALLYSMFYIKKGTNLISHMLVATIVGGFLFSLIWEAKARYIFPYFVLMIPVACFGFERMAESIQSLWIRKGKEVKVENRYQAD